MMKQNYIICRYLCAQCEIVSKDFMFIFVSIRHYVVHFVNHSSLQLIEGCQNFFDADAIHSLLDVFRCGV